MTAAPPMNAAPPSNTAYVQDPGPAPTKDVSLKMLPGHRSTANNNVTVTTVDRFPAKRPSGTRPGVQYKQLHHRFPSGRTVTAYFAVIENPVSHLFVVPATGSHPSSMIAGVTSYQCSQAKPSETARASGCEYATNAGFFNMDTGQCIGNLVHNNEVLQVDDSATHAQFGIDVQGRFVSGYLQSADVLGQGDAKLAELVTGKGWLVRNSERFIDTSIVLEKIEDDFVHIKAPRTGIGYDRDGRLLMLQVDGEEDIKEGADLYEFADLFVILGAYNAVNVDGGGSAATIANGTVIDKPTCDDTPRVCERAVTTILCVR
jgi:Phosphodiester glycosidase